MPSSFPDLGKVWKNGKKSYVFFYKATTSALEVTFFHFGQILFILARLFAAHHEKIGPHIVQFKGIIELIISNQPEITNPIPP